MNPDSPTDPRQELEARLSALILGQLPEEQAVELRQQIDKDPELSVLYSRLKLTSELIREAVSTEDAAISRGSVPRLSHDRREQLLASFKTISPGVPVRSNWSFKSWAIPVAAAAMIIGWLLLATVLPDLSRAKTREQLMTALPNASLGVLSLQESKSPELAFSAFSPLSKKAQNAEPAAPAPEPEARRRFMMRYGLKSESSQVSSPPVYQGEPQRGRPKAPAPSSGDAFDANSVGGTFRVSGGSAKAQVAATSEAASTPGPEKVNVVAAPSLPSVQFSVPAVEPSAGDYLAAAKSRSNQERIESEVELGRKLVPSLGAEVAQVGVQIVTNALADRSAGTIGSTWGDYNNDGLLDKFVDNDQLPKESKKLAESAAGSLGYGVALKDDSGKVLGQQLDEYFAKNLPEDDKQTIVESRRHYALRGDSAGRLNRTPAAAETPSEVMPVQSFAGGLAAAIPETAAVPAQSEVKFRAGYVTDDSNFEIQAGKPTQTAQRVEEKSKAVEMVEKLDRTAQLTDLPAAHPAPPAAVPQPEILTRQNRYSTFSLNVTDVSFKLAAAALEKGGMPEPGTIRSEEFINAFDYHDPEPAPGAPLAFAWEIARSPFAHNRDLIRFSVKTAAQGRQPGRPLNIVVLLDNSGSMERADRARIIQNAFRALATQLQNQDKLSIVLFARTAHLWVDGVSGDQAANLVESVSNLVPQGGTNLEEAMNLAYQTAVRHFVATGINRVVLLTDGAANLGDVEPSALKEKVESYRKQGIALDCFGIGWEGYNDELMETLSRNGDGRYGFLNTPQEAESGFVAQLAGALRVAASDVKVQVEFNPDRVNLYRQIGYAKHQLTKEQFRDNTVDAAEIGAAESGNAMYSIEVNPSGIGPIATLRVRYKVPGTAEYKELEWMVPYKGSSPALEQAGPAMRLATTASLFSEWLASSPYAADVTPAELLKACEGVPQAFTSDPRPKQLEWMIRQAQSLTGK